MTPHHTTQTALALLATVAAATTVAPTRIAIEVPTVATVRRGAGDPAFDGAREAARGRRDFVET